MALAELFISKLGASTAKLLLKIYLGESGETLGSSIIEIAQRKIESYKDQREAQREFERIGENIAEKVLPIFEGEAQRDEIGVEAVVAELAVAFDGKVSADYFLGRDLEPERLVAEIRRAHPLRPGHFSEVEESLYERCLIEIVRYVVDIAPRLPSFDRALASESLKRLSRVSSLLEETVLRIQQIGEWVQASHTVSTDTQYEAAYRLAVIRNLDYVELFGADLAPESRRQALSAAYVSLNLASRHGRTGASNLKPPPLRDKEPPLSMDGRNTSIGPIYYDALPEPEASEQESGSSVPVEDMLNSLTPSQGRLLIRGEAGSGKSTLFRWIAIQASLGLESRLAVASDLKKKVDHDHSPERASTSEGDAKNNPWFSKIPFLIRFRDCKGGRLPTPAQIPLAIAKEIGSPPESWVLSTLRAGRGLVLLDGVDELPNMHRDTARREIDAIARAYPANYFLISTRPEAVPVSWLKVLEFQEAQINPMSEVDRLIFIDKWHAAVRNELTLQGRPVGKLEELAASLKIQLPNNPSIARLATNPLLCAMICAMHREREQRLPEDQPELCEALCQMLLHRRERESGFDLGEFPQEYARLGYVQKRAVVQKLAYSMVINGESSIPAKSAQQKIAQALSSLPGHDPRSASIVLSSLVERSGMLREARPGHIDFIHNTFKEYLAAERFADDDDVGLLVEHALDPSWQRVIEFAVATRREGFASDVIRRLIAPASVSRGFLRRKQASSTDDEGFKIRQLLALRCRAMALYLESDLEESLNEMTRDLFPPKSIEDASALAAGGDSSVPFLEYHDRLTLVEATASVRALRLIGSPRARQVLIKYTADPRDPVVSELATAINPLQIRRIQERLLAGEELPPGISSQLADISELAKLKQLQVIRLHGTRVSDLSPLSELDRLVSLSIFNSPVSNLSVLAALKDLEWLSLLSIPARELPPLGALKKLRSLTLACPLMSVEALRGLDNLRSLTMVSTNVENISPLAGLSKLEELTIERSRVKSIEALSKLRGLKSLSLAGTEVYDLRPLSHMVNLENLCLAGTPIDDVSALEHLPRLRSLDLTSTRFEVRGLSQRLRQILNAGLKEVLPLPTIHEDE